MNFLIAQFLVLAIFFSPIAFAEEDPYRLGSQWGKTAYTLDNKDELPVFLRDSGAGVAKFLGGTAFYLGKFNGRHLMATNYHVLPNALNCYSLSRADFVLLGESYSCKKFIASFSNIELSLFEIHVPSQKEAKLAGVQTLFKSNRPQGPLYILGYGGHLNPDPMRRALLLSHDRFCVPFGDELRFLSDPDQINPANYQVWSLPVGCDVSHGDSGSPVYDASGRFTGIVWTGATPKSSEAQTDEFLIDLLRSPSERVWSELSYMVPAWKMAKVLEEAIERNSLSQEQKSVLCSLLNRTQC